MNHFFLGLSNGRKLKFCEICFWSHHVAHLTASSNLGWVVSLRQVTGVDGGHMVKVTDHVKASCNQANVQIVIEKQKQKQNLHDLLRKQANRHLKASLLQCNWLYWGCNRLVNIVEWMCAWLRSYLVTSLAVKRGCEALVQSLGHLL